MFTMPYMMHAAQGSLLYNGSPDLAPFAPFTKFIHAQARVNTTDACHV